MFENKRVLITGLTGFLGKAISRYVTPCSRISWKNLLDKRSTHELISFAKPHIVIHCAGLVGGLQMNLERPADLFYENTVMGLNVLQACLENDVKKVVSVVASCAYPEKLYYALTNNNSWYEKPNDVMYEADFLWGRPHESVSCHGYAKRNLQLASYFYQKQYGLNAVCVCPTTLYGPGMAYDNPKAKVMGALIKKFCDAVANNESEVVVWGSGSAMREFIYVDDAAKLILRATERYNDSETPLNIGSGQELTIRELVDMIVEKTGYKGRVKFEGPDGQHRKRLDLGKMRRILCDVSPFEFMPLPIGIERCIADYLN